MPSESLSTSLYCSYCVSLCERIDDRGGKLKTMVPIGSRPLERERAPSWDGDCLYEKHALGNTKLQDSLYALEDHKPLRIPEHFLNVMSSSLARYPLF